MRRTPECDYCFSPMGDGDSRRLGPDVLCVRCFEAILYAEIGDALLAFGQWVEAEDERRAA